MTVEAGELDEPSTDATALTLSLLGPLDVRVDGEPVDLGGAKPRALVASLLLQPDRSIPVERLADALWDRPPATAAKSIQVYVSRARRALGPHADRLVTTATGYAFHVAPEETDLQRFDRMLADARCVPATEASQLLRSALALWRGDPLGDLSGGPLARTVIPALEERRLTAVEARLDLDLQLGRHAEVLGELQDLVARHPLREALSARLMLALYRCGRQAEALEVYQRLRVRLDDELGIEPDTEVRALHVAVLQQDPALRPTPQKPVGDGRGEPFEPRLARRTPWRRRLVVGGVILAVVAVATAVLTVASSPGTVVIRADSLAVLDSSGRAVADVSLGGAPDPIAVVGSNAWIGDDFRHTLVRVDLDKFKILGRTTLPELAATLAAGRDVLWVGEGFDGTLIRIATADGQVAGPFFPAEPAAGLLVLGADADNLWIGQRDQSLLRVDPASLQVRASTQVPGRVIALAVTPSAVWSVQFRNTDVRRIDPVTAASRVTATLGSPPVSIVAGAGAVWVGTRDDRLWRVSAVTGQIDTSIPVGVLPGSIAVQGDRVWVGGGSTLDEVDARTGELVRSIRFAHSVHAVAVSGTNLLVTVGE